MRLRNREGTAVDAVPFLVVTAMTGLVAFSFGPIYCIAVGMEGPAVLATPAVAFAGATATAYHRLVHAAHPEVRGEIPSERRIRGLFHAALAGAGLLAVLSLPLLVR